jgi:hypothetical protein
MQRTQVKIVTRYIADCPVAVCVLNMKGEEIQRFLIRDFCCEHSMYHAILEYVEKNNMIEIHNEVV